MAEERRRGCTAGFVCENCQFVVDSCVALDLDLDLESSRQSPQEYHSDEVCTPTAGV